MRSLTKTKVGLISMMKTNRKRTKSTVIQRRTLARVKVKTTRMEMAQTKLLKIVQISNLMRASSSECVIQMQ